MLVYAAVRAPSLVGAVALVGGLGAALLLLVLARCQVELLSWALFLLAAAYAISLVSRGSPVDEGAPLVATGLLLCGELASWSVDERQAIAAEPLVRARRATALGALALVSLGASALVVALAAAPAGRGLAWAAAGTAASVLVVALAVRLSRRA